MPISAAGRNRWRSITSDTCIAWLELNLWSAVYQVSLWRAMATTALAFPIASAVATTPRKPSWRISVSRLRWDISQIGLDVLSVIQELP
jgi:hypothetical protein